MKPKAKAAKVAKAKAVNFEKIGEMVDGFCAAIERAKLHNDQNMMRFAMARYERDGMSDPKDQAAFLWALFSRTCEHISLNPKQFAVHVRESADAARLAEARSDSLPF